MESLLSFLVGALWLFSLTCILSASGSFIAVLYGMTRRRFYRGYRSAHNWKGLIYTVHYCRSWNSWISLVVSTYQRRTWKGIHKSFHMATIKILAILKYKPLLDVPFIFSTETIFAGYSRSPYKSSPLAHSRGRRSSQPFPRRPLARAHAPQSTCLFLDHLQPLVTAGGWSGRS